MATQVHCCIHAWTNKEKGSGVDRGDISPPIFDWGLAYVIIPPILCKVNNILPYLYKYSDRINRYCSKNGWFLMILAKFIKNFSQNAKFWSVRAKELCFLPIACSKFASKSIHQIEWFQLQTYKIFQLLRGAHPPLDTPLWRATKSSLPMLKMDLCPWKRGAFSTNST